MHAKFHCCGINSFLVSLRTFQPTLVYKMWNSRNEMFRIRWFGFVSLCNFLTPYQPVHCGYWTNMENLFEDKVNTEWWGPFKWWGVAFPASAMLVIFQNVCKYKWTDNTLNMYERRTKRLCKIIELHDYTVKQWDYTFNLLIICNYNLVWKEI